VPGKLREGRDATVGPTSPLPAPVGGDRRVTSLDGLRALAILGVLGVHAGLGHLPGGHLGVSVFFVISGYLITAQLVREFDERGRLDLRHFYRRRAARLFPALALCLAVAGTWALAHSSVRDVAVGLGSAALYVGNVAAAITGGEHLADFEWSWTLSLEEQFYLLWPAALLLVAFRRRWALGLLLAGVLLSEVCRAVQPLVGATPGIYFAPHTRMSGLLLGAALALLPVRRWVTRLRPLSATLCCAAALGLVAAGYLVADVHSRVTYVVWIPAIELAAALLVASSWHRASPAMDRLLSLRPLAHLGRISYGVYLWNVPVLLAVRTMLGPDVRGSVSTLIAVPAILAVAQLSWTLLERPILRRVPGRAPSSVGSPTPAAPLPAEDGGRHARAPVAG
jgi:peptidoglycan/LPS O-acetylase OafA/YrhL